MDRPDAPRPEQAALAFISHADCGRHDTGWSHPEHVGRLRAVTRALRDAPDLFTSVTHLEGRHATADELALGHDARYIASVRAAAERGGGRLDADTVVSGEARRAFAAVRPPGHHALRASGMGFCLFGNVAIAAHYARQRHGLERVLIVDWDVHHGNGTQALVENEPDIHF